MVPRSGVRVWRQGGQLLRRAVAPTGQVFGLAKVYQAGQQAVHCAFGKPQRSAELLQGNRPFCPRQCL